MSILPSTKHGNECIFVVDDQFSKMAILIACKKNIMAKAIAKLFFECVWVHFGLPQTIIFDWIVGSSVHFGPSYGHYWTPSSQNSLPSIPKLMVRKRWSIRWLCTYYGCTNPNIHAHGMTTFFMCNTTTTDLFTALLATTRFR